MSAVGGFSNSSNDLYSVSDDQVTANKENSKYHVVVCSAVLVIVRPQSKCTKPYQGVLCFACTVHLLLVQ